jgi:hypothetical protein
MRRLIVIAISVALAVLSLAAPAYAASGTGGGGTGGGGTGAGGTGGGGTGGGGGTTGFGTVQTSSAVASCDAGTFMSVTVSKKGGTQQMQVQLAVTGPSPVVLPVYWDDKIITDDAGLQLMGIGYTSNLSTSTSLVTTLGSKVAVGTYAATLTAVRHEDTGLAGQIYLANPVQETCVAHLVITSI